MRCPICKKETRFEGNPYRPFCSERCKLLDLGNWLEGRYRVPDTSGVKENGRMENSTEGPEEDGG
ncbi:MAG TPA: DNA gyrase inhibitor YacG [Terriglobia bacterium]|nr:DNA gyrase inhibitor YacG [Terriglobia bacterium]